MSDAVIECVGLSRQFNDVGRTLEVISSVDLRIETGEVTAIVGQSGSGKSTLLQLLGGLDEPSAGEVRVAGQTFSGLGQAARLEAGRVALALARCARGLLA